MIGPLRLLCVRNSTIYLVEFFVRSFLMLKKIAVPIIEATAVIVTVPPNNFFKLIDFVEGFILMNK